MRIMTGAALALVLGLAGCSASTDTTGVPSCPRTAIIADASRLVQFGPGQTQVAQGAPQAIALEARITRIGGECVYPKNKANVTVNMNLTIEARRNSPDLSAGATTVSYFVAVVDADQRVLGRVEFSSALEFKNGERQTAVIEELEQRIPLPSGRAAAGYDVLVGFLLTPEQVNLNRASLR
ncbi:MAG: hypothetical protein ACOVVK_19465 [Elsteraceae bacterium]